MKVTNFYINAAKLLTLPCNIRQVQLMWLFRRSSQAKAERHTCYRRNYLANVMSARINNVAADLLAKQSALTISNSTYYWVTLVLYRTDIYISV